MPDLNDFYAFKMTTSQSGSDKSNSTSSNGSGGNSKFVTVLIVLAIIGWVLCLIGK